MKKTKKPEYRRLAIAKMNVLINDFLIDCPWLPKTLEQSIEEIHKRDDLLGFVDPVSPWRFRCLAIPFQLDGKKLFLILRRCMPIQTGRCPISILQPKFLTVFLIDAETKLTGPKLDHVLARTYVFFTQYLTYPWQIEFGAENWLTDEQWWLYDLAKGIRAEALKTRPPRQKK